MFETIMLAALYCQKDKITRYVKSHKHGFFISMEPEDHLVRVFYHDKFVHTKSISGEDNKYNPQEIFQYHLESPLADKLVNY